MGGLGRSFKKNIYLVCVCSAKARDFKEFQRADSEHFERSSYAENMMGTFLVCFSKVAKSSSLY